LDNLEHLRFPVGKFHTPKTFSENDIALWRQTISDFPDRVQRLLDSIELNHLRTPYRKDGWNGFQVIHHCVDSHMNAYFRFKLGLTEDAPEIRPYFEDRWADLPDSTSENLENSLLILKGLHRRWAIVLNNINHDDFNRLIVHPEYGRKYNLAQLLAMYAWHCNHHHAHLELIKNSFE
jgi:hypothetical protein